MAFLIIIAWLCAEILVSLRIAAMIGILPAIGLTILAAVVGGALLLRQGRGALSALQRDSLSPRPDAILNGFSVAIAGVLLIIPGFLSDLLALFFLIPAFRHGAARTLHGRAARPDNGANSRHREQDDVIEGDYERLDNADDPGGRA